MAEGLRQRPLWNLWRKTWVRSKSSLTPRFGPLCRSVWQVLALVMQVWCSFLHGKPECFSGPLAAVVGAGVECSLLHGKPECFPGPPAAVDYGGQCSRVKASRLALVDWAHTFTGVAQWSSCQIGMELSISSASGSAWSRW